MTRSEEKSEEGKFAAQTYDRVRRQSKERAPWLYHDGSENLFGFPSNPGNLVHMSYYLFVVDLICGIAHGEDRKSLQVEPKIPTEWENFAVTNFKTRFGQVSYHLKRTAKGISLQLTKPQVAAEVVLGPLPKIRKVVVNGKESKLDLLQTPEGEVAKTKCAKELKIVSLKVGL